MAASYPYRKGRSSSDGGYFGLPKVVLNHPNFLLLTPHAVKLLVDLGEQYNGTNNGNLCAAFSILKQRGWRSQETLNTKLKELRYYGFIVATQLGGLNLPNLYAVSWRKVDHIGKDSEIRLGVTPNTHKNTRSKFKADTTEKRNQRRAEQKRNEKVSPLRQKNQLRLPESVSTATEVVSANMSRNQ